MKLHTLATFTGIFSLAALTWTQLPGRAADPPPDPTPQDGVEVLARGQVHEAFAEPTAAAPQATVIIAAKPPALIDELPPDQKPAGDNVTWIPGYWGWDDGQKDFIWISGFWRVPPPGRQWVPGSWQQVASGFQWTAGFWAAAGQNQLDYLPPPPPTPDAGASTPAPTPTSVYAPGVWIFKERRYLWRPGFWVNFYPNWVWIPAHYVWTPAGYVFVEGYWDHPLTERGLLFAPVRIAARVRVARWVYTPSFCVQPDFLIGALFVRPDYCHYYFGDYFTAAYAKRGFVPWIDFRVGKDFYDPNFAYYRHRYGSEVWEKNLRELYVGRTRGDIPRPPHTLVQQTTVIKTFDRDRRDAIVHKDIRLTNIQNVSVIAPVNRINNVRVTGLATLGPATIKVEPHVIRTEIVPKPQAVEIHKQVEAFRQNAQTRHVAEAKIVADGHVPLKVTDAPRAERIVISKPIVPTIPPSPDRPKVIVKEIPKAPVLPRHEERPLPMGRPPMK